MGRKTGTHPSHDLKEYVGDYGHPGYGVISIAADGDGFKMMFNRLSETLKHYHYDTFQVPENPFDSFEKLLITFQTDANGEIAGVSLPLGNKDTLFSRLPDKQLTERGFIAPFAGQYEIPGSPTPATVELRGDHTLVLTFPGEAGYELIPQRGTTFGLKSLTGISIEFKRDESGKVSEAVLHTPGNAQIFKRKQ